ncbi:hypothetical protein [Pseudomonas sp.]|uniref:hypothetical protein n=1 Tax=Pseudomonas sp. TaxID=306 RepID=UPI00257D8950|nr:hypothetical protein [Pseudomonas sp.]
MKQENNEQFLMLPYQLMKATGFNSVVTGELVTLSMNEKAVYTLMKSRATFFNEKGSDYYDSCDQIGMATGIASRTTVSKIINKFIEHGVIKADRVGRQGFIKKLIFKQVRELDLVAPSTPSTPSTPSAEVYPDMFPDMLPDMPLEAPEKPQEQRSYKSNTKAKVVDIKAAQEPIEKAVERVLEPAVENNFVKEAGEVKQEWNIEEHKRRKAELEAKEKLALGTPSKPKTSVYREATAPAKLQLTDEQREAIRKHQEETRALEEQQRKQQERIDARHRLAQ